MRGFPLRGSWRGTRLMRCLLRSSNHNNAVFDGYTSSVNRAALLGLTPASLRLGHTRGKQHSVVFLDPRAASLPQGEGSRHTRFIVYSTVDLIKFDASGRTIFERIEEWIYARLPPRGGSRRSRVEEYAQTQKVYVTSIRMQIFDLL